MFFGGGFPGFGGRGGMGDDDDQPQGQIDNTKYYQILGVDKKASQNQIKKAYLNLAKVHHPDKKSGDTDKFKQISQAYQTLGDAQKRRLYDKYGSKGPSQDPSDIMNMFFDRGRGRQNAKKQMQKVKPTRKALQITLQNSYNGDLLKIEHKRTRCCQACQGKGGKNVSKCTKCKGRGQVVQMFQMGPGMYQQVQKKCDDCKGQGQIIGQGGKCKTCNGNKILQKSKTVQVAIQKGIPNNYPITLNGEGNQIPDALAGDLIFVVQQQPHKLFTRKGADLFMKKQITLVQSLTGFDFSFKHLDGTQYTVATGKGQVIGDHDKKVVKGLGMPFYKDPMSHGNLIIEFTVLMLKRGQISKQNLQLLSQILPGKVNPRPKDDNYDMLLDFDLQNVNTNEQGGKKPDEQQQEQAQYASSNVGCANQ